MNGIWLTGLFRKRFKNVKISVAYEIVEIHTDKGL